MSKITNFFFNHYANIFTVTFLVTLIMTIAVPLFTPTVASIDMDELLITMPVEREDCAPYQDLIQLFTNKLDQDYSQEYVIDYVYESVCFTVTQNQDEIHPIPLSSIFTEAIKSRSTYSPYDFQQEKTNIVTRLIQFRDGTGLDTLRAATNSVQLSSPKLFGWSEKIIENGYIIIESPAQADTYILVYTRSRRADEPRRVISTPPPTPTPPLFITLEPPTEEN